MGKEIDCSVVFQFKIFEHLHNNIAVKIIHILAFIVLQNSVDLPDLMINLLKAAVFKVVNHTIFQFLYNIPLFFIDIAFPFVMNHTAHLLIPAQIDGRPIGRDYLRLRIHLSPNENLI